MYFTSQEGLCSSVSPAWGEQGLERHSHSLPQPMPVSLHSCPSTAQHHTHDMSTCTARKLFPLLDLLTILPQQWQTINLLTQKDDSWMSLKALAAYCAEVKPGGKSTEAKLQGIPPAKYLKYIYIHISSIKK